MTARLSSTERARCALGQRVALLLALSMLLWVGLFCDPIQFWLADVKTSLYTTPSTNQQGVTFNGHNLSPVTP